MHRAWWGRTQNEISVKQYVLNCSSFFLFLFYAEEVLGGGGGGLGFYFVFVLCIVFVLFYAAFFLKFYWA